MKIRYNLSVFFILFLSYSLFAQNWTQLNAPYNYTVNSCWIDESVPDNGLFIGWRLAGADPVSYGYRTNDGGNTLNYFSFNYYFWSAQDVFFTNSNNGIVVGSGIVKTNNGGNSWTNIIDVIQMRGWMHDVMFNDANSGYTVGQTYDNSYSSYWGVVYITSDGGNTWNDVIITEETQNQNTEFRSVYSIGNGIVYAGTLQTAGNNTLFRSSDNGNTWTSLNFSNDVNSILFTSANIGYIASDIGIFKTTDSGLTWNNVFAAAQPLKSLSIKNNIGFAVGNAGKIYKSENNGLNWSSVASPVTQNLNKVFVVNENLAYAVGVTGIILKYQNSITGIKNNSAPNEFTLGQNYPNPFNPSTTIQFSIPNNNQDVKLKVYDSNGKLVKLLLDRHMNAGNYDIKMDGSNLTTGIYFYSLIINNKVTGTKKMMLIK